MASIGILERFSFHFGVCKVERRWLWSRKLRCDATRGKPKVYCLMLRQIFVLSSNVWQEKFPVASPSSNKSWIEDQYCRSCLVVNRYTKDSERHSPLHAVELKRLANRQAFCQLLIRSDELTLQLKVIETFGSVAKAAKKRKAESMRSRETWINFFDFQFFVYISFEKETSVLRKLSPTNTTKPRARLATRLWLFTLLKLITAIVITRYMCLNL